MIDLISKPRFQIYQHHTRWFFIRPRNASRYESLYHSRYYFFVYIRASLVIGHTFFSARQPELIKEIDGRVGPVFPYRMTSRRDFDISRLEATARTPGFSARSARSSFLLDSPKFHRGSR